MSRFTEDGQGLIIEKPKKKTMRAHDVVVLDRKSVRTFDQNGFLHIALTPISKETVNPYYGREIPGYQDAGLDPNKIYYVYRSGDALRKGAATFNRLNVLADHRHDTAEDSPKELIIGSLGDQGHFADPYLMNSMTIKDATAIELLNPSDPEVAPVKELSASYSFTPVFKSGTFKGQDYDLIMTDIVGNHVAIVPEGRAGPDVAVADANTAKPDKGLRKMDPQQMAEIVEAFNGLAKTIEAIGGYKHEGGEQEAEMFVGEGVEENTSDDEETEIDMMAEEKKVEDDSIDEKFKEIFALLDGPEDALAAEPLRKILMSLREMMGGSAEGEAAAEDEETEKVEVIERKEGASDRRLKRRIRPLDPKAIEDRAIRRAGALFEAANACRATVGDINPMAAGTPQKIYRTALSQLGVPTKSDDLGALKTMYSLALAKDSAAQRGNATTFGAFDSATTKAPSVLANVPIARHS